MIKTILAFAASVSSFAIACPNLEGVYVYSGKSTIEVQQTQDHNGVTFYEITVDDHTCAVCKYETVMRADGKTVRRDFPASQSIEFTTISCDNNRLQFRRKTEFYEGGKVAIDTENFDYRVNADSNLVMEVIRNDVPVSKSVYKRITEN